MEKYEAIIAVLTATYVLLSALARFLPQGSKLQKFCAFVALAFQGRKPKDEAAK